VLQTENLRFRELLRVLGVNEALTDSYVNQGISAEPGTSLRQIRPRIAKEQDDATRSQPLSTLPYPDTSTMRRVRSDVESDPTTMVQVQYTQATQYMFAPVDLNIRAASAAIHIQNDTQSEVAFFCDTFHVPSAGVPLENSDNTVLCSVTQDNIQ
jgi:hypothetical protein